MNETVGQAPFELASETEHARLKTLEAWQIVAFAIGTLFIVRMGYLVLRRPGPVPIFVYALGPILLTISASLTLLAGTVRSFRYRPFLQGQRAGAFVCLALVIGIVNYPFPFPSVRERRPSTVDFNLPVQGEWTVAWGGDDSRTNLLARWRADRRWGLDLLQTDEKGKSFESGGTRLADFHAFDEPVYAPCSGLVVGVRNDLPDNPPGSRRRVDEELGNHVILRSAEDEYLFLAHLKEGSVRVVAGQTVERGEELGRVGNSGFSHFTPEPHLAIHLQDSPKPRMGQAVPWYFTNYESGGLQVERGLPKGGKERSIFIGERVRPSSRP